jgi:hypothetical protein
VRGKYVNVPSVVFNLNDKYKFVCGVRNNNSGKRKRITISLINDDTIIYIYIYIYDNGVIVIYVSL